MSEYVVKNENSGEPTIDMSKIMGGNGFDHSKKIMNFIGGLEQNCIEMELASINYNDRKSYSQSARYLSLVKDFVNRIGEG